MSIGSSYRLKKRGFTPGEIRRLQERHRLEPGVPAPIFAEFILYHLEKKLRANTR